MPFSSFRNYNLILLEIKRVFVAATLMMSLSFSKTTFSPTKRNTLVISGSYIIIIMRFCDFFFVPSWSYKRFMDNSKLLWLNLIYKIIPRTYKSADSLMYECLAKIMNSCSLINYHHVFNKDQSITNHGPTWSPPRASTPVVRSQNLRPALESTPDTLVTPIQRKWPIWRGPTPCFLFWNSR